MKKINYIILILISIFILNNVVSAKSVAKVCNYNNDDVQLVKRGAATITIYSDGSADAVIRRYDTKELNNTENVQNWSSIKGTYQSNNACPTYVNISYGGIFGAKVWAYYNESEASAQADGAKIIKLDSKTAGQNASESEKQNVNNRISVISNYCNSIASTTFDPNSCKDTSNITTRFRDCKVDAGSKSSMIGNYMSEVDGYVSKGYISKNDDSYKKVKKLCDSAQKNVDEYSEALTYIDNQEYNKEMGTNIESSVKASDVNDNKYVNEYYKNGGGERTYDTDGTEVFQICDTSKHPQLVASLRLVGIFVNIIKIIVPVIMIIMGSLDMSKAVIEKDNDAIQKSLIVFLKRSIAGVLIFLAPSIILGIFHLVEGMGNFESEYQVCADCLLGSSNCPNVKFIQGS